MVSAMRWILILKEGKAWITKTAFFPYAISQWYMKAKTEMCRRYGMSLLIWKKEKASLIHDYHYRNVRKADLAAYTRLVGIGLILIGAGVCLTGLLHLIAPSFWWLPMLAGFLAGFLVLNKAQRKYNGSWFS